MKDVSVVTITYNEKENINRLIEDIQILFKKKRLKGEIVIVDDSSPDGTGNVIKEKQRKYDNINLIEREGKQGIASAYRKGVEKSKGDVIITMDADFSHPPSKIMDLYSAAKNNILALGSRYVEGSKFEINLSHFIGTKLLNSWISFILKTKVKDHTNGFLGVKKEILTKICDYGDEKGNHPFDIILYGIPIVAFSRKLNIPVKEIVAPYVKRSYGESKISMIKGLKIVLGDILYAVKLSRL